MLCFWKQQNEKICATGIKFWSHGWNCVRRSFFLFFPLQPLFPQPLATTAHDFIDDCENLWNCGNHCTSIDVQQNVANMGIQSQNTNGQRERKEILNIRNIRRSIRPLWYQSFWLAKGLQGLLLLCHFEKHYPHQPHHKLCPNKPKPKDQDIIHL